jgi:outer membrane protein OmpA-like peptidoglycan-associated protein
MKHILRVLAVVSLAAGVLPACASKSLVNDSIADVNRRVDAVSQSLNETRERGRVTEARLGEVDLTAQQAHDEARSARDAASAAGGRAEAASKKADAVELASRRVLYTVVLSEDQGQFAFGRAQLPESAVIRLADLAEQVKADPQGAFFEIEGHTDSTGSRSYNEQLGLKRAEAVKRYLYEKHQIPLHRMSVITYGPDKPVATNGTRDGRAQNRRVVVKVLI